MRATPLALAAALAAFAGEALAQPGPEPPPLRLPMGARVRLTTRDGARMVALLARHDAGSVALVFPPENPLVPPPELVVPAGSINRLELSLGKKRHAVLGAALGAVLIGLTGFSDPIDTSDDCGDNPYDYSAQPCSRAEAVAIAVVAGAEIGGVAGHFVKTERWTPVALDALGPSAGNSGRIRPEVRASAGGVSVGLAVRF
jgi:hypothetical protein